jgi:hypothetical protein
VSEAGSGGVAPFDESHLYESIEFVHCPVHELPDHGFVQPACSYEDMYWSPSPYRVGALPLARITISPGLAMCKAAVRLEASPFCMPGFLKSFSHYMY